MGEVMSYEISVFSACLSILLRALVVQSLWDRCTVQCLCFHLCLNSSERRLLLSLEEPSKSKWENVENTHVTTYSKPTFLFSLR